MKAPTRKKVFDLVGESRPTKGGLSRQTVLLAAQAGDPVLLLREPDNAVDTNAVLVLIGEHDIGYLGRDDAAIIGPAIDSGLHHRAQLHEVTGGVGDAKHYGARISIAWGEQKLPPYLPRDERQEAERDVRASRLQPESSGCLTVITMTGLPLLGVTSAISYFG